MVSSKARLGFLVSILTLTVAFFAMNGPLYANLSLAIAAAPYGEDLVCDNGINVDDAVVGSIVAGTAIFWEPVVGSEISGLFVSPGQTFWVLGVDATNSWYKIVIACQAVWVPLDTVGPNYAEPWLGRLLPTTVVE